MFLNYNIKKVLLFSLFSFVLLTSVVSAEVQTFQSRVSADTDDAEERVNGSMYLGSSDLELVFDDDLQTVGIRFIDLAIPENAVITTAYIQFKADEISTENTQLTIHAENIDNAATFSTATYNISSRTKTNASVSWLPAEWSTVGAAEEDQRTSDLTSIVQEIVSRSGWISGNAMAFIITGTGKRVAESYKGDQTGAPLLYVEYTTYPTVVPPVITLIGDDPMNLNVGDIFSDPGATAQDNEDGNLTALIQSSSNINTTVAGTYQVIYTVTDSDGNSATVSRSVIVNAPVPDTTEPVITLIGANPMNLNVGDIFSDPGGTAEDNIDGNLTASIESTSDVDTSAAGTYTVTYTVSDRAGNSATSFRSVIVSDGTLENHMLQSRVSADADDAEERVNGSMYLGSSDLELVFDHDLQTVGIRFIDLAIPENAVITTAYIQFKADEISTENTQLTIHAENIDNAATFSTATYNISSRTKTNASVSWLPAEWSTVGAAEEDQRTSDLTSIVQEIVSRSGWISGNAMAFIITGTGKRVAESYKGDQTGAPLLYVEYTTYPTVVPPVITLIGDDPMNLNVGDIFSDPGATAQDNEDGNLTALIQSSSNINTTVAGTYQVIYTVTDSDGNSATVSRSVIVNAPVPDTTEPVITLIGANPMNLNVGDIFSDPGGTAEDNIDGNLTASIESTSDVDTSAAGTYTVTYTVSDRAGNSATSFRSVIVSDGTLENHMLQSRVSADADDAEERVNGSMYLGSSDLELVFDHDLQTVGIRFIDLAIPENAVITTAYIQFKADEISTENTQLTIHAENIDNAATFSTATYNISSRTKTNASVSWLPAEWSTVGAAEEDQRTSDLTSIVQEIVSRSGWISGNAMAFIITGTGKRVAESYKGDQTGAPLLYVEYTTYPTVVPPVITLIGDDPMNLNVGDIFSDPGATAQDNEDGNLTALIQSSSNINTTVAGTYQVIYTVTDSDGNSATVSRSVIVNAPLPDTTKPIITLIGANPQILTVGDTYTELGATANDNEDGNITGSIVIDASTVNMSAEGNYTVTYNVSDTAFNAADTVSRTVTVRPLPDTTKPIITLIGANPQILTVGDTYTELGATANDNEDGNITGSIVIDASTVNMSAEGNYTVTYNVSDTAFNAADTVSRTVTVRPLPDTTKPIITLIGANPQILTVGDTYTELGATANDNEDGNITGSIVIDASTVNMSAEGNYTVTYNVSDTAFNAADTVSRTVTVRPLPDTTKPIITLIGANPQILTVGDTYTELGATANDNEDGNITGSIVIDASTVNMSAEGNYTVTYNVSDTAFNAADTVSRTVTVRPLPDTTKPIITLLGENPMTVNIGELFIDPGVTAVDNLDGNVTNLIQSVSTVDTSFVGTYTVTYTVSDSDGNNAEATRTVIIVADTTEPVITLIGANPMNLNIGDIFSDPGATAQDNEDGNLTALIQSSSNINTTVVGTYQVIYTVTDSDGNSATVSRSVIVNAPNIGIIHEDAEDGSITGWIIYDSDPAGATITNIYDDELGSRVIKLSGEGTMNGYRLRNELQLDWNDRHTALEWKMKYSEHFKIYVKVSTLNGSRYLVYTDVDTDELGSGSYIFYGLGEHLHNGIWQTITRNLDDDIKNAQPENELISIEYFRIQGSGRIDDIISSKQHYYTPLNRTGYIKRSSEDAAILGDLEAIRYIESDNEFAIVDDGNSLLYRLDPVTQKVTRIMDASEFGAYTQTNPNGYEPLNLTCQQDPDTGGYIGFCDPESIAYDHANDDIYIFTGNAPGELTTFKLSRSAADQNFSISDWKRLDRQYSSSIFINDQFYVTFVDSVTKEGKFVTYEWNTDTVLNTLFTIGHEIEDTAYANEILWMLTAPDMLYKIRYLDMFILDFYDMRAYDINDPRGVEVVGDKLYIGDGFDGRTDDLQHAIHIFDLP